MTDITWAMIIIWFFFIAVNLRKPSKLWSVASSVIGIGLMIQFYSEAFVISIAVFGVSAYLLLSAFED